MIAPAPTVAEERAAALKRPTPWRVHGTLVSIVFFALTCVAIGAFYFLFDLLLETDAAAGLLTGVVSIGAAEYLVRRFRFFGTGIESALWLGGLFALILSLPGEGQPEAILLFAGASLIAGLRLRQPYFGVLAVMLVISYFGVRGEQEVVLVLSLAATALALAALAREWQRPSMERFLEVLLITSPIAPAVWGSAVRPPLFVAIYAALTITLIAAGIWMRHHAVFVAALVTATVAFIRLQDLTAIDIEWQLLVLGLLLLVTSALISRALRDRTRGFVVTPVTLTGYEEALQIGATIALQPEVETPKDDSIGKGGSFGGAGATGEF